MSEHMPIYVGDKAIEAFIAFCKKGNYEKFFLIADENTSRVLGERVHQAIQAQGWDVLYVVLDPEHLHTDDFSITRVLASYDAQPRLFVAVGSGTITDITRFTSHRTRNSFVSFPTAASVDAYTSRNAPVTVGGLKGSIYCHAPIAIFTDLQTICESPRFLTASGFGDSIGKYTSSSDWKYTHLIWGSDFDEDIYEHALHAARQTTNAIDGILQADPASMANMMDAQFESGFCMADFKDSSPASGGEHHIAHIWEMMYHWDGREGLFHGNGVGVAVVIEARWYAQFRALSKADAKALLDKASVPDYETQKVQIEKHLPLIAEELIEKDPIYMQLSDPHKLALVKERILEHWDEMQAIAENVPTAQQVIDWLQRMGAPTRPQELGLSDEQVRVALDYGLYLRERFSMNIIRKLFGWQ